MNTKEIELDLGVVHNDGFIRKATIRKMKTGDRLQMTSVDARKKPFQKMTSLLSSCTVKFGDDLPASMSIIDSLNFGDRDKLLLELRKFSMGNIITVRFACSRCQEEIEAPIDLEMLKCRSIDDPSILYVEAGDPYIIFKEDDGTEVHMRIPNGKDQAAIAPLAKRNPLEADYELYRRCLKKWGEKEAPFKISFIHDLDIDKMDWLEREFKKHTPGPDWNIIIDCDLCGHPNPASLGDTDFLFQSAQSG